MPTRQETNLYQKRLQTRRSARVLIVDDMASIRKVIAAVLREMGFEHIAEAGDGAGALKHIDQHPIDFLICDWNMPGMTGLEVVIELRKRPNFKDVPVLMVTAEGSKEQVADAIRAGVTSYVVKPFLPATLKAHIDKCLRAVAG